MDIRKATATPEEWEKHLEYMRLWRLANLDSQRAKKRAYSAREDVKERRRIRDNKPEAVARRRAYHLTAEAKKRAQERHQERFQSDPEYRLRRNALLRKLRTGFDHELVVALIKKQDNRCAICRVSFEKRRMVADHCHASGRPRGLLCHHCNIVDGMLARVDIDPLEFAHRLLAYRQGSPAS